MLKPLAVALAVAAVTAALMGYGIAYVYDCAETARTGQSC